MEEILECCVVAVPHPKMVKAASCHIVMKPEYFEDTDRCESAVSKIVAKVEAETGKIYTYYVPGTYEFRRELLPRTSFGKVDFLQLEKENELLYNRCNGCVPKVRK